MAWNSPAMALSIWVDWSTVTISTCMPAASHCSLSSWALPIRSMAAYEAAWEIVVPQANRPALIEISCPPDS